MKLFDIITKEVPELSPGSNGLQALTVMEQFEVKHLPIVAEGVFLGLLSEEEVLMMSDLEKSFELQRKEFAPVFLDSRRHVYDGLYVMADRRLTLLPVTGEDRQYLGCILAEDMLKALAFTQAVSAPGAVVVLEMNAIDYSLTRIAQMVEGNNAKILSATLTTSPDSMKVQLTLKINQEDLSAIMQTFNRYDYLSAEAFMEPKYTEEMRERYEEFMKYLNM
jgi:CBS domain-containing protein